MTVRDTLIIANTSLHPALCHELVTRGVKLRVAETWAQTDRSDPERILGAYTWFYEGLRHPVSVWRMARWLRRHGIPLFVWNRDAPHYLNRSAWRLNWLDRARLFDIYATHTLIDGKRNFADSVLYLANAADTEHYNLRGTPLETFRDSSRYKYDVTFVGAMDGNRYKEMRARQEFFAALGEKLRPMGVRYLFREPAGMSPAEQVDLIQTSRINLNYWASCEYGSAVASGLPERCYGIPACGGFLLCDHRTHARDDFTPGENWAEFSDLDDCVSRIRFWLERFAHARNIAERCHVHVLDHHTYAHRAAKLHHALLRWHDGQRGRLA